MPPIHQHYVPRHLLRGFLSVDPLERRKEQTRVYDLIKGKQFTTKIDNIMGGHRFNDLEIDASTTITIDPALSRVESHLNPLITRLRQDRRLTRTGEEQDDLALLFAFQFIRARGMREAIARMNKQFRRAIERRGRNVEQVAGWPRRTNDEAKEDHMRLQVKSLDDFTKAMRDKVYFLAEPPPGNSLYLGDNPVVMANDMPSGHHGNLGLSVPFIQLYLPIAADLLLCSYSPEVIGSYVKAREERLEEARRTAFSRLHAGAIEPDMMRDMLIRLKGPDAITGLIDRIETGRTTMLSREQVKRYNSLQAFYAVRLVADSAGDFAVARDMRPERERAFATG